MGRTYRGLSRKEREEIRRARDARRYKHNYDDEEDSDDRTTYRKKGRDKKSDLGRDVSNYGYYDGEA